MANTFFMQSKTVCCELQSGRQANFIHAAVIVGIFPLKYQVPGMANFDPKVVNVLLLDKAQELLARAVSLLENNVSRGNVFSNSAASVSTGGQLQPRRGFAQIPKVAES
jgi:hypothetical protein